MSRAARRSRGRKRGGRLGQFTEQLGIDLRLALRLWARTPGFSVVAIATIALGVGASTALVGQINRQEISVRMAIGASASSVVALMVRESLVPVLAGAVAAIVLLVIGNQWLAQLLYGVSSDDPVTLLGACIVFAIVAVLAAALPSRAAVRVDPALALRQ
jgi:ABC-type antimicrobial peptide transport system permease subunit